MSKLTAETVKNFLLKKYESALRDHGMTLEQVPDNFDLFAEGIVDSLGVLNMISDVETAFGIKVDMEKIDAEEMTILGSFSRYAAEHGTPATAEANGNSTNGHGLDQDKVQSELRNFIRQNYSIAADDQDFTDEAHLYKAGFIDPMESGALKNFVESKFAIQVTQSDLAAQPMNTVRELSTFVVRRHKGEI